MNILTKVRTLLFATAWNILNVLGIQDNDQYACKHFSFYVLCITSGWLQLIFPLLPAIPEQLENLNLSQLLLILLVSSPRPILHAYWRGLVNTRVQSFSAIPRIWRTSVLDWITVNNYTMDDKYCQCFSPSTFQVKCPSKHSQIHCWYSW